MTKEYRINLLKKEGVSPAFVLETKKLLRNLQLIQEVIEDCEVEIILALKAFSMWSVFPLIRQYLSGATASSLHEARLIYEEMGAKAHTYAPAYLPDEIEGIIQYSKALTFNSLSQFRFYESTVSQYPDLSLGLRVNPEISIVQTDLYNPASSNSRLGEVADNIEHLPKAIKGLHFHVLCESSAEDLEKVLEGFIKKFGKYFSQLDWVNFGGGHLITKEGYNLPLLKQILNRFKQQYGLQVILEPGSAIAWNTGFLFTTVLDIITNHGVSTAIIDASFTAHMPDTLEMPYRPKIWGATHATKGLPTYRIGGVSCLAGDFLEAYSFGVPLKVGTPVIFEDMIHYTMVKTTTFNGVKHPSICILKENGTLEIIKQFGYLDFKNRLS